MKIIIDDLYKNRPMRIYTDTAQAIRAERQGLKVMSCREFGKLVSEKYSRMHDISRRIYAVDGECPTIHTMQGGNTELKIAIPNEPINKESINVVGNCSPSGHDASRIVHPEGIAPTVKENHGTVTATLDISNAPNTDRPFIVASRGRNPENPSDRTAGVKTEQRLEANSEGLCNTLTSVQKDNYVAEPLAFDEQNGYIRTDGTVGTIMTDGSSPKHNNRVVEPVNPMPDDTCRTIKSQYGKTSSANFERCSTFGATGATDGYRIRKLTPKECWRLMAFNDEDFGKASAVCSNTQLYKQAGNSIVVNVLMAIFWELLL